MTEHLLLLQAKLAHLSRMRDYLAYSLRQIGPVLAQPDWALLSDGQHESMAAFRVRFSEFQEHLGKFMRAVAIKEEKDVDRFGAVLAFMERLQVLDSAEHWKLIRELRNAVNHEYEDDTPRLAEFFALMASETPVLFGYLERLRAHCISAYGL